MNRYPYLVVFMLIQGSRKRPRLEKGQEAMDTDMKKEEDVKSEPKGIESHLIIAIYRITLAINDRKKAYNNYVNLLFRK